MYIYYSFYSLPFTGFESLPAELVQTNLSKSLRNPQVICPATWSFFPGGHSPFYDGDLQFKVGFEPPEPRFKYLENFHWYRLKDWTPNLPFLEVGCTTTWAIGDLKINYY